ncbi:MAG: guanylate kinase [Catenibacillus sp.]
MARLFCVMGKSASGKDTIYKALAADESLKLQTIVPYTTRPVRSGETQGVEYYFTDEENYQKLKAAGRIIEDRAYETIHGLWRYFTADDGQIDVCDPQANYIVIGTLEAYRQMLAWFGPDILIPVYVEVEDGLRLERALRRERSQANPRYAEMCRRFLADCEDFSEDKIKECCIGKRYDNIDLSECLEQIRADIRLQSGQDCK